MASVSVSPSIPPAFSCSPTLAPTMPSGHARKKSRSPHAASLPAFTFNPTSLSGLDPATQLTAQSNGADNTPIVQRASRPPPLPDFTFNPGAALLSTDRLSPTTHPVLEEMAMNQQRMSRSARPSPLPAFTFAPGVPPPPATPSPSRSDFLDANSGRSTGGHKRAGSEFVGGGGTDGPALISTSPAKHDAHPNGPPVAASSRRGHVHRRSQAVSITDIETSDLIKAHAIARTRHGSSIASGPSTPAQTSESLFGPDSPLSRPPNSPKSPPLSPHRRESTNANRPRVEFADKIDVIPRPLSMISSETEGSCSTIRYSHSLSNSINSIASPSKSAAVAESPPSEEASIEERPRTADAYTSLMSFQHQASSPIGQVVLPQRPLSAYASPDSPEMLGTYASRKKHFWSSSSPDRSPSATPREECGNPMANLPVFAPSSLSASNRPKTSPERSVTLRKKKRHSPFSSGIFSKKSRNRASRTKVKRTPTPPALQRRASDQMNEIFDADDTIVLRSESPELKRTRLQLATTHLPPPSYNPPEELISPILDLDAALGSFGSEERLVAETQTRTAASRIAKLHSSERRGTVDAFGVHRRTESAPTMQAFNRGTLGIARHGSNPSLAEEVFDEEEEDNFLAGEKNAQVVPCTRSDEAEKRSTASQRHVPQIEGLGLAHVSDAKDRVVIVDPDTQIGLDDEQSSSSTLDAPILVDADVVKRPMTSPMSFHYSSTQSHYASSTEGRTTTSASMISSPDPDYMNFDVPRLTPAMGQHSPDFYLRPSNEDLPSLTDSISSGAIPRVSSSANTRSSVDHRLDQRANSMFVPGTSRSNQSWKRSSLASLNRLIPGSANGSRLKFETMPDPAGDEKTKKKANRLSKLVNFWRNKDKLDK